jgi:hypothetical protein
MVDRFQVVHHIPGRLRVRIPRSKRHPHLLHELRDFVSGLGGVERVEINPVTGSVLVHYHPESQEQIQSLLRQSRGASGFSADVPPELSEGDDLAEKIEREAAFLAAHSEAAAQLVNAVKHLNRQIRQATDNAVDLKVLLPAGLAICAFVAGAEAATPLWVTLAIFSFNSFVVLHHPIPHPAALHTTIVER